MGVGLKAVQPSNFTALACKNAYDLYALLHLSFPKILSDLDSHHKAESSHHKNAMLAILHTLGMFVVDLFKSRGRLEAENMFLRHQLNIALRHSPPRLRLHGSDRALLV